MKKDDIFIIEERLKKFELNTGCDLLLIIAQQSDKYSVAPWRFSVLTSCFTLYLFSLYSDFLHAYYWPISFSLLLFSTHFLGRFNFFKKFFIKEDEIDHECYEFSVKNFYTLGLSKTTQKVTAMIMVSLFEKKITVLIDELLKEKITQEELDELVKIMQIHFKKDDFKNGWLASINSLEDKILKDFEGKVSDQNQSQLSDKIHFI